MSTQKACKNKVHPKSVSTQMCFSVTSVHRRSEETDCPAAAVSRYVCANHLVLLLM